MSVSYCTLWKTGRFLKIRNGHWDEQGNRTRPGNASFVKQNVDQRIADLNASVVSHIAKLAEFVHEVADAGARGADHGGEHFLADLRQDFLIGLAGLSITGHDQEGAGEPLFAGVEELIHKIGFNAGLAREQIGGEEIGEEAIAIEHLTHPAIINADDAAVGGRAGAIGVGPRVGKATFAEEIPSAKQADDRFLARFGRNGKLHAALFDVINVLSRITLRQNELAPAEVHDLSPLAISCKQICRIHAAAAPPHP